MSKVMLKIDGKRCEMSNGIISIVWKEDGSVCSLTKNGKELIKDLDGTSRDSNAKRTFYVDYHAEGSFRRMTVSQLNVITNTEDLAHIAYVDTQGLLYIEYHILLMKGESGIYTYIVVGNNTDSEFSLSELRTVYRFGNKIFDHACNTERIGLQPTHKYMEQFECLQDETYRLPDGTKYTNGDVYSKYDYASYFRTNPAWGHYGHGFGFFVIPASTEYYPGGPLKQELLAHYDGIVLNYFTGAHFGTGPLTVPTNWKKFYGPFFVYINAGEDGEALYQDALDRAKAEQSKWPYQWVKHELYPLTRSAVTGKLTFSDGTPCQNTTVILAKSGICFERQSADYIFYCDTQEDGSFLMNNVRYGNYTLYAYQTGSSITEQLEIGSIDISKGTTELGNMTFPIPNHTLVWQLGKSTRTSEGFKYGGEQRNYKWSQMVPRHVNFTIGKDNAANDWYYAQFSPSIWNLNFNLSSILPTNYYLTVALAGICKAGMKDKSEPYFTVSLNGVLIKEATLLNDSSVYRSATLNGRYRRLFIPISSDLLRIGENTISFHTPNCAVMYDTVVFERD